jgi:hypothetical protein
VLQVSLLQAPVACTTQLERACPLRDGPFDSGAKVVALFELFTRLLHLKN